MWRWPSPPSCAPRSSPSAPRASISIGRRLSEVLEKLDEELAELKDARASGDQDHIAEEMGDILFVMANLARKLKVDPEEALRRANAKFTRRFQYIEAKLAEQGRTIGPQPLDDMEALWLEAKRAERRSLQLVRPCQTRA
jgi:uncharacterized protein YabN with tetrapyrrole methylase and pyrophosphatase domain